MASGEAELVIDYPPQGIIDFVMDLKEYRKVDDKLGKIYWIKPAPDGEGVFVRFRPRLMGMPGRAPLSGWWPRPTIGSRSPEFRRGPTRWLPSTPTSGASRSRAARRSYAG